MVLYVMKWNVRPESMATYSEWSQSAIKRILGTGQVVEFRAYRPASGSHQVVVTHEFADMAAWSTFVSNPDIQHLLDEMRAYATDIERELWGPSFIVPEPIRPGV